jgi:hypothetical protein
MVLLGFLLTAGVAPPRDGSVVEYAASRLAYIFGGLILLRGAPIVVAFAYPKGGREA